MGRGDERVSHSFIYLRNITTWLLYLLLFDQLLENDIQAHQDRIDDVMSQVRQFRDANHFQIDQIEDRGRALVAK